MNNTQNWQPVWQPDPEQISTSHMARFAARYTQISPLDYAELHQWSIDNPDSFWSKVWDYAGIKGHKGSSPYVQPAEQLRDWQWFPGARLNFAENLLGKPDDSIAIISRLEDGDRRVVTRAQLHRMVAKCAHFLRSQKIVPGDCVAGMLPNCLETVVAMLATTSLGAVWCSCSPDFGLEGAYDRFSQVEPKVLFSVDGYSWKGKGIDVSEKVARLAERLAKQDNVCQLVEVPFWQFDRDQCACPNAISWAQALENSATRPHFEQFGFDQPLGIMFSSGTTGKPKCIIHRAGGVLLQHVKEHMLHSNIRKGDKVFFYTSCSWMMWNWLVSSLAVGATLVLFDGSPVYPRPGILWEMAEEEGISFFGTSAKYLQLIEKFGVRGEDYNLSELRTIASTGSPLMDGSFDYVYSVLAPRVHLASISGGADLLSCLVLGNPCLPVYRGEIQCAGLGLQVDAVDDNNRSLYQGKGELVCRNAFPSVPLGFGQDQDGSKYHKAYFAARPGLWSHSDYAELRAHPTHQGFVIHGRLDSTLNPGGVKIGTAEIYRQVEKLPEVIDAVAVGQQTDDGDQRVLLFVVLVESAQLDEQLTKRIRREIAQGASPRHVPEVITQVADIPRTHSGKIAELAVTDLVNGREPGNIEALANPESFEAYRSFLRT